MNTPYPWRCYAFDGLNDAEAATCTSCGFPASATGKQIGVARESPGTHLTLSEQPGRSTKPFVAELLAPLNTWRKVIAITGMLISGGGLLWLKVTLSFMGAALSIGASLLGLLILGLAYAGAKLPSDSNTGVPLRREESRRELGAARSDA